MVLNEWLEMPVVYLRDSRLKSDHYQAIDFWC